MLAPLAAYWKASDRDDQGRKRCRTCATWQTVDQFNRRSTTSDGLDTICLRCCRDNKMRVNYGITLEAYLRMLEDQGDGCAICGGTNPGGKELAVDHDHRCCPGRKSCGACVRGLLCSSCNLAIGMLGEDPVRLDAAASYLRR
ncbi:endonuclease VII domain-containing protein [Streptomyces brevispora]|uniref:endonuclease VII domain-containing protein n=1 Tax=Streptomyces brevispora TaxID=887462 RepID=UPI0037184796